ncbi:DUF763 domain-containing protein [Methanosarcinales archaeon]|nr:MAG: DUF763 domain-containing protein [Methanosarcinales archaeon]
MKRTGYVNLPLHSGRTPRWLFERMVKLAGGVCEVIVMEYGTEHLLRRLSDPFWFQAFSHVLGFDWHSSGTTTTTCGALKLALSDVDVGVKLAGGKGKTSLKTVKEIPKIGDEFGLSSKKIDEMVVASKLSAKVDNACVQDGFSLYHHSFVMSEKGEWAVIQQGMKDRYARRYHWLSMDVMDFCEEPHSAICSDTREKKVLDMTSSQSREARKASLDIVKDAAHIVPTISTNSPLQTTLLDFSAVEHFTMPSHHEIRIGKDCMGVFMKAYELQPESYEELILIKGMGPKKIRALALLSELLWGVKASWKDPVKYTFAHGGKDGHPFPVDRETYDNTIDILRSAIEDAKCEKKEKMLALKRLQDFIKS